MIDIARATIDDALLLADLSTVTFIQTYSETCSGEDMVAFLDAHFDVNILKEDVYDKENYYFIAYVDDIPAGFIRFRKEYVALDSTLTGVINLKSIYVLHEYQNQKVGASLIEFTIQFAKQENISTVTLSVWENNNKAIAFYKRFQFIDSGKRTLFLIGKTAQRDHIMMKDVLCHITT